MKKGGRRSEHWHADLVRMVARHLRERSGSHLWHLMAICCHPLQSVAIRCHPRPSEAIGSHQWPSEAISGHQWPSEVISANYLRENLAVWRADVASVHSELDLVLPRDTLT